MHIFGISQDLQLPQFSPTCFLSAMIRYDKKVLLLQKQQPIKPTIYMYTSAGKLIEQIQVRVNFILMAYAHIF
jgi:hypothetical protein